MRIIDWSSDVCSSDLRGLWRRTAQLRRHRLVEPRLHRRERGMAQVALQQTPDAGDMLQVAVLAVAPRQPRENADDLGVALRAEGGIGGGEGATVDQRAQEIGRASGGERVGP